MLVFVPNPQNPLYGQWMDLTARQRVKPTLVRTIVQARAAAKAEFFPPTIAREDAVRETARMLGLPLAVVEKACLDPKAPRPWKRPTKSY